MPTVQNLPPDFFGDSAESYALLEDLFCRVWAAPIRPLLLLHLQKPSLPVRMLSGVTALPPADITSAYRVLREDATMRQLIESPFYPRRMLYQLGRQVVTDLLNDPEYALRLMSGQPVSARILEIHATRDTCNFKCKMCLCSSKYTFPYVQRNQYMGLMCSADWRSLIEDACRSGTHTIVFSGGGEPLLNPELFDIIGHAHSLGLKTHLYTNGSGLLALNDAKIDELLKMARVRISMHATDPRVYQRIVGIPVEKHVFERVCEGIQVIIKEKNTRGATIEIGIGFVIQPLNHSEINRVAVFAAELGVDFCDFRRDELEVARKLSDAETVAMRSQLQMVRRDFIAGRYASVRLTLSDALIAAANGVILSDGPELKCFNYIHRPVVDPYGVAVPCDMQAGERFQRATQILGNVRSATIAKLYV